MPSARSGVHDRRAPLAAVAGASLLLSACSAGYTATGESSDVSPADTITIGATAAPASLDFTTTSGAAIDPPRAA